MHIIVWYDIEIENSYFVLQKSANTFYMPLWKMVVLCLGDVHPSVCQSKFSRQFSTYFEISVWNLGIWPFYLHYIKWHKTGLSCICITAKDTRLGCLKTELQQMTQDRDTL